MCAHVPGSPPHLRGKLNPKTVKITVCGITPAPAGKTKVVASADMAKADHPRTCGENKVETYQRKPLSGSPPHLRGKQTQIYSLKNTKRITPAPAGKTYDNGCK